MLNHNLQAFYQFFYIFCNLWTLRSLAGITDPTLSIVIQKTENLSTCWTPQFRRPALSRTCRANWNAEFPHAVDFIYLFSFKYSFSSKELFSPPRDKGIWKQILHFTYLSVLTFYNFQHSFTRVKLLRICDFHESCQQFLVVLTKMKTLNYL